MALDQDFSRRDLAGAAKITHDYLDDHFDNAQGKLDAAMFRRIDGGECITAAEAQQFIFQKHANHTLAKKMLQDLKSGQSAGTRIAPRLGALYE